MGQVGGGIVRALDSFKPPERQEAMEVTPSLPPPPPPPDGARIRRAATRSIAPPKPPTVPILPQGSMPGSSNDPPPPPAAKRIPKSRSYPRPLIPGFPTAIGSQKRKRETADVDTDIGPRIPPNPGPVIYDAKQHAKNMIKKPETSLVKLKDKKKPPAGLSKQSTIKNHQEELTKHGVKPIVLKKHEDMDKHIPHVDIPPVQGRKIRGGGLRRKRQSADPPPVSGVKRPVPQRAEPAAKRTRRVSAHAI